MIKIYEVMSIESGKLLFLDKHIIRFKNSIAPYIEYSFNDLKEIITELSANLIRNAEGYNLKVSYLVDENQFTPELVKSRKPKKELYISGVKTGVFKAERENPLIKKENLKLRESSNNYCKKNGFYDVLLLNHLGHITEGSRSNFLLIKDGEILTSPIGEALNGVTREVIFEICKDLGFEVRELIITEDVLKKSESMIITGTSPGILPVSNCGSIKFTVDNNIIKHLQEEYNKRKVL